MDEPSAFVDRRQKRRSDYDADQRALYFSRRLVLGERGQSYILTASSHINSTCWIGTVASKNKNDFPCLLSIQVFKEDLAMRGSIWREVRAVSAIESKGSDETLIPSLIDQGTTKRGFKFAITTFTGKPLAMVLRQFPAPLKPQSALLITLCVTRALAFVHGAGYVHGNVSAYSVLTGNGLSSDNGNIRLGGFYYSAPKDSSEKISYPLNIYTARAVHQKKQATVATDLEGLVFLGHHLMAGLPWAGTKQLKKMVAAKEKFFDDMDEKKWEKVPQSLRSLAQKLKEGKSVDLAALEADLSPGKTDEKVSFEWETTKMSSENLNKPTQVVAGFFYEKPKIHKEDRKERIEQLQEAVGPDR